MAFDDSLITSIGGRSLKDVLLRFSNETKDALIKSLDEKASTGTSQLLRQSIDSRVTEEDGKFVMTITLEDYYKYIDQGVQGVGGEKKGGGIFEQVAPNSPFSYTKENKPSVKHFEQWSATKGLNPFAVRESVFRKGIRPNMFYSNVVNDELIDNLVDVLEKAGAKDIEVILKETIENGNNN